MPGFVEITCSNATDFRTMPCGEFKTMIGLLKAASERVRFEALEMSVGHHVNPHGVTDSAALLDHVCWPDVVCYDWVHCMLQGGVLNDETEALLAASSVAGVTREGLQRFLADGAWSYPQHCRNACRRLHRTFDVRRAGDDDACIKVKGTCSELLSLYGQLRFFFELKLGSLDVLHNELASFRAVCDILDLILAVKHGFVDIDDGADKLAAALKRHLDLHLSVYGPAHCKPKHHWLQDVPAQIRKDRAVLDAFIIERTHLRVKALAEHVKNTTSFEQSVLSGVLTATAQRWQGESSSSGLRGRTARLPGVAGASVADAAEVLGIEVRVGDVVVRGASVAEIAACADQHGELFLFVVPMDSVRQVTSHCDCHRKVQGLAVWRAIDAAHAVAWQQLADGTVLVLRK